MISHPLSRPSPHRACLLWVLAFFALLQPATGNTAPVDAITFHADPGRLFLPVDEAAEALRWQVERDELNRVVRLHQSPVPPGSLRELTTGQELVSTADLERCGAQISQEPEINSLIVRSGRRSFILAEGPQRVEISLPAQELRAWQGARLVLQSRLSSGRRGSTPTGDFHAGPYRAEKHFSKRYHNAPMPWSVQIRGHVFIHGFTSVPRHPASHGCIRLPLDEGNPARFFFEWVLTGTPVRITR